MLKESILPKSDPRCPYNTQIPQHSKPTEVLSKRFELWRQVNKSLITYFRSLVVKYQTNIQLNHDVVNSIEFPFFTDMHKSSKGDHNYEIFEPKDSKKQSFFSPFGDGSVQDLQILLKKYHINTKNHCKKIVDELSVVILRLEDLNKDLLTKIKEIGSLSGDFKSTLNQEIAITGQLLNDYIKTVENLNDGHEADNSTDDPFLKMVKLETQLKKQIHQENYLEEAFINLQSTSVELEKIIYKEIQDSLNKFAKLISEEIFINYNDLINELNQGVISRPLFYEWDKFIERDDGKNLLKFKHDDKVPALKKLSNLKIPYQTSIVSKSIRSGYLLKKSKFIKTYNKYFYVLTLNYLHEFKAANLSENSTPLTSIKLNDCILVDSSSNKFQLQSLNHTITFKKTEDMDDSAFKKWIQDLKNLTSFNSFKERFDYLSNKLQAVQSSSNNTSPLPVDLQKQTGTSSRTAPNTTTSRPTISRIKTDSSTLTIPSLTISAPTPVRPTPPPPPPSTGDHGPGILSPIPVTPIKPGPHSIPSSLEPSRVNTPMIGDAKNRGEREEELTSPIDLKQRLYDENTKGDLARLLKEYSSSSAS